MTSAIGGWLTGDLRAARQFLGRRHRPSEWCCRPIGSPFSRSATVVVDSAACRQGSGPATLGGPANGVKGGAHSGESPPPAPPTPVEVTVRRGQTRKPGIRVYRVKMLRSDETTRRKGVPITTPARTVLYLAGVVSSRDPERAVARAERSGLATRRRIAMLLDRYPHRIVS